jgi:hypothetical protein
MGLAFTSLCVSMSKVETMRGACAFVKGSFINVVVILLASLEFGGQNWQIIP